MFGEGLLVVQLLYQLKNGTTIVKGKISEWYNLQFEGTFIWRNWVSFVGGKNAKLLRRKNKTCEINRSSLMYVVM